MLCVSGGDPHRRPVPGTPGGKAAHHDDFLHPQQARQAEGLFRYLPVLFIGQGVAGAVQGAEGDIPPPQFVHPGGADGGGTQHGVQIDVGGGGPVAGADFHRPDALAGAEVQHIGKGHVQGAGFDGEFHSGLLSGVNGAAACRAEAPGCFHCMGYRRRCQERVWNSEKTGIFPNSPKKTLALFSWVWYSTHIR